VAKPLLMASLRARTVLTPSIQSISRPRQFSHSPAKSHPFVNGLRSATNFENGDKRVLRMLMFGKPGAGKGTLSAKLVKKYDIMALSTGDLLRQHIAERWDSCPYLYFRDPCLSGSLGRKLGGRQKISLPKGVCYPTKWFLRSSPAS
jgi:hypothetical protein